MPLPACIDIVKDVVTRKLNLEFIEGEMVEWHEWKTKKIANLKSSENGTEAKIVNISFFHTNKPKYITLAINIYKT